jgi:hypothetical protein
MYTSTTETPQVKCHPIIQKCSETSCCNSVRSYRLRRQEQTLPSPVPGGFRQQAEVRAKVHVGLPASCPTHQTDCSVGRRPEAPGPGPRVPLILTRGPALGVHITIQVDRLCLAPWRPLVSSSGPAVAFARKATARQHAGLHLHRHRLRASVLWRRAARHSLCAAVIVGATTGERGRGDGSGRGAYASHDSASARVQRLRATRPPSPSVPRRDSCV